MVLWFFTYAFAGRLIIFLFQKVFSANYKSSKENFLTKLFSCDLCLGFWVYFALAFFLKIDILELEYKIISECLSGAITTFLVWLVARGWDAEFREITFE